MNTNNSNFVLLLDGVLCFFGFELLKTQVAIPKSSGDTISFRCCPKSEAQISEFIEITNQTSRSPSLISYFKTHNALGFQFTLIDGAYYKTDIKIDITKPEIAELIAHNQVLHT
jgi:hypothetical protein